MAFRLVLPLELRLLGSSAHSDLLNINFEWVSSSWERVLRNVSHRDNVSHWDNVSLLFLMLFMFSGLPLFLFRRLLGRKFSHLFDFFGNAEFQVHVWGTFRRCVDHFLLNWLLIYRLLVILV